MSDFTDRLDKFLTYNKISRHELAKKTEIAYTTMCGWYGEGKTPSVEAVKKIADFFGVTMDMLYYGADTDNYENNFVPVKLSLCEQEIIDIYRKLSSKDADNLYEYARMLEMRQQLGHTK